jgi:hypothetical protein
MLKENVYIVERKLVVPTRTFLTIKIGVLESGIKELIQKRGKKHEWRIPISKSVCSRFPF